MIGSICRCCADLLEGCAATNYLPLGSSGGYSETQLAEDTYKVNFKGNENTIAEQASDFSLFRYADLTLANGYQFFRVISEQSQVECQSYSVPSTAFT